MLIKGSGYAERHIGNGLLHRRFQGEVDSPLNFADVLEILIQAVLIRCADPAAQRCEISRDRIEDALLPLSTALPLLWSVPVAEQTFENSGRIDLLGQRLI